MVLKFLIKEHFGRQDIYPMCELSKNLVKLTGRKTFNVKDIEWLRLAGFIIEFVTKEFIIG